MIVNWTEINKRKTYCLETGVFFYFRELERTEWILRVFPQMTSFTFPCFWIICALWKYLTCNDSLFYFLNTFTRGCFIVLFTFWHKFYFNLSWKTVWDWKCQGNEFQLIFKFIVKDHLLLSRIFLDFFHRRLYCTYKLMEIMCSISRNLQISGPSD